MDGRNLFAFATFFGFFKSAFLSIISYHLSSIVLIPVLSYTSVGCFVCIFLSTFCFSISSCTLSVTGTTHVKRLAIRIGVNE